MMSPESSTGRRALASRKPSQVESDLLGELRGLALATSSDALHFSVAGSSVLHLPKFASG